MKNQKNFEEIVNKRSNIPEILKRFCNNCKKSSEFYIFQEFKTDKLGRTWGYNFLLIRCKNCQWPIIYKIEPEEPKVK